jgi:5-methyltetrahydrofolate--homocysteine methyltransferase
VYGFFPANAVGEDIEVYSDDGRTGLRTVFHTLRQQGEKSDGQPNFALADFLAPRATGVPDFLGCFAVTAGIGEHELCAQFEREHDDYSSILTKALADRLAEAFAEWLHRRARADWGYGAGEDLSADDLIHERYRGIRPAPGYPACPDHSEKRPLFDLIRAEDAAGIRLTENFAMMPASSICGFYFAHPQARYFAVGKIGRDQVLDYQRRKGVPLDAVERSLAVHLTYDPGPGATPAAMGI